VEAATGGYKETKFYWVDKGVGVLIVPLVFQGQHNLGRGKGAMPSIMLLKE